MAYSVDVINPFSALQDEDDFEQTLQTVKVPPKNELKIHNNVNQVGVPKGEVDQEGFITAYKGGRMSRKDEGFGRDRGNRAKPSSKQAQKEPRGGEAPSLGPAPQQHVATKPFLTGKGREQVRGRGRAKNRSSLDERGKREFDRYDGTGRGHEVEKRSGTGRGNWGTFGDDTEYTGVETETEDEGVRKVESKELPKPLMNGGVEADTNKENDEKAVQQKLEEKVMTLEEYEQQRKELKGNKKKKSVDEEVTQKQFEGMQVMKKVETDMDEEMGLTKVKELGKAKSGDAAKAKKEKEIATDLACFRIGDDGGKRGGRGGRSKSDSNITAKAEKLPPQNGRDTHTPVNINSFSFPQLGEQ